MKNAILFFLFLIIVLSGCKRDEDIVPSYLIDPADADALTQVLIMPSGTESSNGLPPTTSNSIDAPTVGSGISSVTSSNGSTALLNFQYGNVSGNLGGCYVQVDGAGRYFTIPYNSTSGSTGNLSVPVGIPTNVDQGEFCINYCIYDTNGLISNVVNTCVNVLRLGTGSLQISLSWDTATDQDLHVTDPTGEEIYYADPSSLSGGILDRDDLNGFGPENIFWLEDAPEGEYKVMVHDFENTITPNTFYITVSGRGQTRNFTGIAKDGEKIEVVTFTKRGDRIIY